MRNHLRYVCETRVGGDQHEFLGIGYDQEEVNVVLEEGSLTAWMYVARRSAIDPALLPYSWYLDYIIHGAYEHQLPDSHIDCLMDFESLVDPDSTRHARSRVVSWAMLKNKTDWDPEKAGILTTVQQCPSNTGPL